MFSDSYVLERKNAIWLLAVSILKEMENHEGFSKELKWMELGHRLIE